MKYVCLEYLKPGKFEDMSESKRNTVLDECFSCNDELRPNGVLVAEEGSSLGESKRRSIPATPARGGCGGFV